MRRAKVAKRYAKAVCELAEAQGVLRQVADELSDLARLVAKTPALASFLRTSDVPRQRRLDMLEELLRPHLRPWSWRVIAFLESRKRLSILSDILDEIRALWDQRRRMVRIVIESPDTLDEETAGFITEQASHLVKAPVTAEFRVIPSLIAGFRLRIGDTIYDQSASGSLRALGRSFHAT